MAAAPEEGAESEEEEVEDEEGNDEPMEETQSVRGGSTQIDLTALTAHFKNVSVRSGAAASVSFSQDEVRASGLLSEVTMLRVRLPTALRPTDPLRVSINELRRPKPPGNLI